jgi:hypothetical protein
MTQGPTEALAESTREEAQAEELELDRVAWNLPLSAVDEASRRADDTEPDAPATPETDERGQ